MSSNFPLTEKDIIASGDYYFYNFLNSKVKLTDLGLYILDTLSIPEVSKTRYIRFLKHLIQESILAVVEVNA